MAAYAVSARISRADPHLAGHWSAPASGWSVAASAAEPLDPPESIDLVARPLAPALAERWADLREAWAQTTFYLFNAEGWR